MPIQLANFTPQVNQSSVVQPPPADDFATSVAKGYEAGRILKGMKAEEDAIKLAAFQQKLAQEAEEFPVMLAQLKGQVEAQPYATAKVRSDILGESGIVTNADTGPVVPTGTSPMELTTAFAAPEGGGQVPSDTVPVGLPGMPGVGRSPSLRQKEEQLKLTIPWQERMLIEQYKRSNPISKKYAPQIVGIDQKTNQSVYFDKNTDPPLLRFSESGDPVTDPSGIVPTTGVSFEYIQTPDGLFVAAPKRGTGVGSSVGPVMTGGQTPSQEADVKSGGVAPKEKEEPKPLVGKTAQSQKINDELRTIQDGEALFRQMKNLYERVEKRGRTGGIMGLKGRWTNFRNFVQAGSYDPDASAYVKTKAGLLASLRGITGDDARFSDADALRIEKILANIETSPEAAKVQWNEIFDLVERRKKIRWEDELMGKTKKTESAPAKPSTSQKVSERARTINF